MNKYKCFQTVTGLLCQVAVFGFTWNLKAQDVPGSPTARSKAELTAEAERLYERLDLKTPAGIAAIGTVYEVSKALCEIHDSAEHCDQLGNLATTEFSSQERTKNALEILKQKCTTHGYAGTNGTFCESYGNALGRDKQFKLAIAVYRKSCDAKTASGCSALAYLEADNKGHVAAKQARREACILDDFYCVSGLQNRSDRKFFADRIQKKCSERRGGRSDLGNACTALGAYQWREGKTEAAQKLFATECAQDVPEACVLESAVFAIKAEPENARAAISRACANRGETVYAERLRAFYDGFCSKFGKQLLTEAEEDYVIKSFQRYIGGDSFYYAFGKN